MDNQNNTNYETVSQEEANTVAKVSPAKFCPNCGAETKEEEMFCGACGTNLSNTSKFSPLPKNGKLKDFIYKKKKLLLAIGAGMLAIAIIWAISFGIMCSIAKNKVIGKWESEQIHSSTYGGDCVRLLSIEDDGTWLCAGVRISDGTIVYVNYGTWYMEGMEAVLKETGKQGRSYHKYHLNDKLTNGYLKYTRMED